MPIKESKKAAKARKPLSKKMQKPAPEPSAKLSGDAENLIEKPAQKTPDRETMISFRRSLYSAKMIGTAEGLIPFAWRQPLKLPPKKKMTKVFKEMTKEQWAREMLMPVKQD